MGFTALAFAAFSKASFSASVMGMRMLVDLRSFGALGGLPRSFMPLKIAIKNLLSITRKPLDRRIIMYIINKSNKKPGNGVNQIRALVENKLSLDSS
jgi:hypothetical protein